MNKRMILSKNFLTEKLYAPSMRCVALRCVAMTCVTLRKIYYNYFFKPLGILPSKGVGTILHE